MELLKSRKLREEEANKVEAAAPDIPVYKRADVIRIRPIQTFNEYVIVMPFALDTTILLPNAMQYQPYGVVVGVSNSIMAPDGRRVASALKPGEVVRFWERNVIDHDYKTPDPYYSDRRLVLISERNVISRLPPVPVEIIDEDSPAVSGNFRFAAPERSDSSGGHGAET